MNWGGEIRVEELKWRARAGGQMSEVKADVSRGKNCPAAQRRWWWGYSGSLGNTPNFLVKISKSVLNQD